LETLGEEDLSDQKTKESDAKKHHHKKKKPRLSSSSCIDRTRWYIATKGCDPMEFFIQSHRRYRQRRICIAGVGWIGVAF